MLNIAEIKEILRQERIFISKRRGQNFLVDANIQRKIIQAADINSQDTVLEIGPGLGALTEDLARQAAWVIAVEKDKALFKVLKQGLSKYKNLKFMRADILDVNLTKITDKRLKVIGNLPYYIGTPIVGYLLEEQRERVKDIFITVQYEVGRRLVAERGSKDYAALTMLVRYFTKPELLFSLPKRSFYPQPKVDSVFVHLHILKEPPVNLNSQKQFFKIIQACFQQRRKTITNSLAHHLINIEKDKVAQALSEAGVDIKKRPEDLSINQFAQIEDAFYKRGYKVA
jgi:16S rRNA (adenine1518-N6/adenine1519-N6)-dimethyltransferase